MGGVTPDNVATEIEETDSLSQEIGKMTLEKTNVPTATDGMGKEPVCTYYRGGVCRIHGRGARRTWRKTLRTVLGPGGKPEVREVRQTSYVCDLGPGGVLKLRQTTLSSLFKTTPKVVGGEEFREGRISSKGLGELPGTSAEQGAGINE